MFKWFRRDKDKEKEKHPVAPPPEQPGIRPEPAEEEPEAPPFSEPQEPPSTPSPQQPEPEKRDQAGVAVEELIPEDILPEPIDENPVAGDEVAVPSAAHRGERTATLPPEPDLSAADVTGELTEKVVPEEEDLTASAAEMLPPEAPLKSEKRGFFARLADRLTKTKDALVVKVRQAVRLHGKVDEELLEEIEAILIQSDVGVQTTTKIIERIRAEGRRIGTLTPDNVLELFKDSIEIILLENAHTLQASAQPTIVLVVGVNGTGKTTTIGKIAKQWRDQGKRVMMVAADTFRAAAIEQLSIWAKRTGSTMIRPEERSDPAAVVFEALEAAKRENPDVILIDTAGRLHTKINLMDELKKIVRVIQKHYPDGPHETLLVLDATTGQNAVNQVKIFHDACTLTGLIMTKLDGTAKGGVLIACKDMYQLPIVKIGIGESAEDLRDFNPHEFVEALFSNGGANGG